MNLPLKETGINTWELFNRKLGLIKNLYSTTLENMFKTPSEVDAWMIIRIKDNELDCVVTDDVQFTELQREELNSLLGVGAYKRKDEIRELVKLFYKEKL